MRSIRMRLMVVFSGVILLVCLTLGVIATVLISDRLMDNSFADLQELAQSEAKYVTSVVNSQLQYLDGIASHPYIADNEVPWDQKSNYLQQEATRVGYKYFVLANLSGQGEETIRNGKSVNVSSHEFFKQASSGKSVVSDVLINPVTGEAEIFYAVPLKNAGRISGVLYAIQDAYILTDIVNQTNYRSTGYAYVINNDGTTVAHSNFDLVLQQDNDQENVKTDPAVLDLANLTRDYIMKRISGTGEYTYNGSHRMVGYAPIENTPWILITGVHANEVKREVNAPRNVLIGIVLFSTFFGGIATFILSSSIAKPVQSLTPALDKISNLDLRLDESLEALRYINRKDEIGEVLRGLRTMESDLAQIIGEVQEAAHSMATTGENLSAAAEENSATIEEVASSAGIFSQNVDQLHERAEAMGTSANAIDQLALEGQKKMNASMDAMGRIRSGSEEVEGSLQGLAQQTQNMERVLNLISEIADQTNLLALNAAIEAARAGEHGRGFAVVAEEVRNLAEQTQNSIVEITQMIGDLVRNATRSAQVMAETNKEVQNGTDLLNQTQEGLANITNKVMETNLLIREMSESVSEMQQGSANIAAATEEQAASMEEIASSTQSMANVGDGLREIVARFKI